MQESKIELTHRLQADGRWDAACVFRDEVRLRLRAEGRTKREAGEGAWAEMALKFPPEPLASDPGEGMDAAEPAIVVRGAVLQVAENETRRWCAQHGVMIGNEAFGELCGTLGAYWALGMMRKLPTLG